MLRERPRGGPPGVALEPANLCSVLLRKETPPGPPMVSQQESQRERIVALEADPASRDGLIASLREAGFDALAFATAHEVVEAVRQSPPEVVLLEASILEQSTREILATLRGFAPSTGMRVILLAGPQADERSAALDLGADDAISRPWNQGELLARIRTQIRARRAEEELRRLTRVAEEGQQIAHTAFEALAVTEKMASDATSLDRRLKIGLTVLFVVVAAMAGIYVLFAHSADTRTKQASRILLQLEGGIVKQEDLIAETRKLRAQQDQAVMAPQSKDELQQQAAELRSKMAAASPDELSDLRKQVADTNARLKRVEQEGDAAQNLIPADVQSVCLLHVAVAFRNKASGQRLRYAGLNQQGEPIQDSSGNPVIMLDGNGPEIKMDVFGTGFLAGAGGRVITNRHVAEPWWKNDELASLASQDVQAEISSIRAYFPGDERAFSAEIQDISKDTDLATLTVNLQDLKRPVLAIDSTKEAAQPGEPIVLMGYATGLAALLARTSEDNVQQIMSRDGNDISRVLDDLAKRKLIRPLITQGHIGDVLTEEIVFDAQTTSGGSGGPLFNPQGKVIGVTFAVLKGFGGSNFGIPIRLSQPLLAK
jgi:DNA-binding response OmpR family regulator/S1-C subfamily serine protease